jgi:hypothetical protein
MTISTLIASTRTVGNGATTAFSFPYHFFENGDLLVYLEVTATGVATLQTISTHYTVAGADDPSGGTVTFLSAPTSAQTVVIVRKPDLEQTVNFTSFAAGTANDALDRLYEVLQYDRFRLDRAIRLPDTAAGATLELPHASERAGMALGFDDDGNLELHEKGSDILAENQTALESIQAYATAAASSATSAAGSASDAAGSASDAAADASAADTARLAAVAAKEAAETAEDNASTSAANASGSDSSASSSASSASTSASNAATSETNAASSAVSALNSRNNAETFATNASNSATAAATAETNAETAETNAETAQAAAEVAQAAAEAAQAATYIARDVAIASSENPAFTYRFDNATADADPGSGEFRLNHATLASVTAVYVDNVDLSGNTVSAWLDTFDDNNNTNNRGTLIIRGVATDNAFFIGRVTGSVTDGTGYRKLTVAHIASGGTFTAAEPFSILFVVSGNDGEVLGPDTSVVNNIAVFDDTDGNSIADSGKAIPAGDVLGTSDTQTLTNKTLALGSNTVSGTLAQFNSAVTDANLVAEARSIASGAGLTGGGDLSGDRTLAVGAGTGITVNADDVALDTAHARNVDHSGVTLTAGAGLTGGGTIESNRSFTVGAGTGITVNADDVALDTSSTRNTDHSGVTLTAGAGLTGGGDISASRSFAVGAGTGIVANADDVAVDKASDANVRAAASNKVLTTDLVESASAGVALTDAATVAVDWDAGINFTLTVTANRAIGNPTNGQPGTWRTIMVQANSTTDRTVTFGNQYLGEVPTITDCDSDRWYLLSIYCHTTTHFVVSSKKAKGT